MAQHKVCLLYTSSTSFAVNPDVYYDKRGRIVRAFYAYTLLDCDDLFEAYSAPLARLSRLADFAVCGATEARESAVLTCRPNADAGQVACTKYNASGRNFTQLSNVCVTIRGADEAICAGLKALLSSMDFRQEYLAIGRGGWLEAQLAPLGQVSDDTFYRYICLLYTSSRA